MINKKRRRAAEEDHCDVHGSSSSGSVSERWSSVTSLSTASCPVTGASGARRFEFDALVGRAEAEADWAASEAVFTGDPDGARRRRDGEETGAEGEEAGGEGAEAGDVAEPAHGGIGPTESAEVEKRRQPGKRAANRARDPEEPLGRRQFEGGSGRVHWSQPLHTKWRVTWRDGKKAFENRLKLRAHEKHLSIWTT